MQCTDADVHALPHRLKKKLSTSGILFWCVFFLDTAPESPQNLKVFFYSNRTFRLQLLHKFSHVRMPGPRKFWDPPQAFLCLSQMLAFCSCRNSTTHRQVDREILLPPFTLGKWTGLCAVPSVAVPTANSVRAMGLRCQVVHFYQKTGIWNWNGKKTEQEFHCGSRCHSVVGSRPEWNTGVARKVTVGRCETLGLEEREGQRSFELALGWTSRFLREVREGIFLTKIISLRFWRALVSDCTPGFDCWKWAIHDRFFEQ